MRRLLDASGYSWKGLAAAFGGEAAFRQELLLCGVLLAAAFWLAGNLIEFLALVLPLFVLLIVELLNSAIESAVDRMGDEQHELSGRAKDMGSAAVLLALLMIGTAWGAIGWQYLHG